MKEEELYDSYKCPNCEQIRQINQLSYLFKWNKQFNFPHMISVLSAARKTYTDYQGRLRWACDICIEKERVIVGRPDQQNWTGFAYPFFTHNDELLKCESCDCEFMFSKEEKRFWYENLKFIVWSYPKHCSSCRRRIRAPRIKNNRLTELISNVDRVTDNEVEEIIDIFLEYGNIDKAKFYLSVLRKRKPKQDSRVQNLRAKIDNLAQHHAAASRVIR